MQPLRTLLIGLEEETVSALQAALPAEDFCVRSLSSLNPHEVSKVVDEFRPQVLCGPAGSPELHRALQMAGSRVPFVAVSRRPNPREWLAAVRQGASDYFGPPFERNQVSWVLQSATRGGGMPAVLSLSA